MCAMPRDVAGQLSLNAMEAMDRMGCSITTRAELMGDVGARKAYYRIIDGRQCSVVMLVRVARLLGTTASKLLEGVA